MKKRILFLIIIILTNFLIGCWDKRELSEITIASAVGIDKVEDEYLVTVQIINPSEIAGRELTGRSEVSTYRVKGKTVFEALRKLTRDVPRKVYLGHLMILMIGEELAKEGIIDVLDFFSRDHELRTDFYIVVTKDSMATDVLNVLTAIEKIPAEKLYDSLEMAEKSWGNVRAVQLDQLISDLINTGKDAILTGVSLIGQKQDNNSMENVNEVKPKNIIRSEDIAVFNGDKLVGWLTQNESRGYNAIVDNLKNTVITIPCNEKNNLAVELLKSKSKMKSEIKQGIPNITVKIDLEVNIADVGCNIDIKKTDNIKELEKNLENQVESYMNLSIKKAKKLKSDIFGFGLELHRKHPKEFKELRDNWEDEFSHLDINIKVKSKIRGTGTTKDTFIDKIDDGVNKNEE
ncbi:Ger(x)C family spore germination protein [Senegalia massiliensis]|uniref:Ger(X)C family spore germination protein n=1 Tax=Senegalia massiliensis TaxID=1720316 RepID=A0A845QVC6_9CLOT|nr:Ger(x)C family spore germination protein [Senegalia massiliensis]NBI05964.1 Ger(x)C family spore germination protein [Senegalia massiliensis]